MRALELNHPWGTENLLLVEHPDPTPGPGEVVVRMRAVSLNYRDTLIATLGGYGLQPEGSPRVIPFSDGCADFVMEVGGAGTLDQSLKAIRIGGHVAVIGIVSDPGSPAKIEPSTLIATSARLQGVSVGSREMYEAMGGGSHFGKIVLGFA